MILVELAAIKNCRYSIEVLFEIHLVKTIFIHNLSYDTYNKPYRTFLTLRPLRTYKVAYQSKPTHSLNTYTNYTEQFLCKYLCVGNRT